MTSQVRRRRLVAAAVLALVLVALVVLAVRGLGGGGPPASGAAGLMPRDTLVYAHVSTDGDRDAVKRATELLGRFSSYERQRDALLQRLTGSTGRVRAQDVEPWLGDEAAIGLVDLGQATAGSLVAVAVTDEAKARRFIERNPARTAVRRYKGDRIDELGIQLNVAFKNGFLLVGQSRTVNAALDRANGRIDDLTDDPTYRRATADLPEDRVAHVFASAAGLRRLLVPQGDLVGGLAVLFDQPALQGVAMSLVAEEDAARLKVRSALDAAAQRRQRGRLRAFSPALADAAPADALAYLGVRGISGTLGNLVTAAAGGAQAGGVGPLLERLRRELGRQTGGSLERDLLKLLENEVAVVINRATPTPTLSLITEVEDEDRTAGVLRRLQEPLARLLRPEGEPALRWGSQDLGDGVRAATLQTPTGASVSYAVFDGRLVLGTGPEAIRKIKDADDPLPDADAFEDVTEDRPDEVTSLGFLDFSQLLQLGEQTGLNESRAYLAARDDLQKIEAVGVSSTGGEGETTAEILLSVP